LYQIKEIGTQQQTSQKLVLILLVKS